MTPFYSLGIKRKAAAAITKEKFPSARGYATLTFGKALYFYAKGD